MGRRQVLGAVGVVGAGLVAAAAVGGGSAQAHSERATQEHPEQARQPDARHGARPLYIGTYTSTGGGGTGLGLGSYRPDNGAISVTGTVQGVADPSFLALSPDGGTLYAVDEQTQGAVTAIAFTAAGPKVLGAQPTGGADPCHLSVHTGGRHLLSANYTSGSIAVHPIASDGSLGARTDLVQHSGNGPDPVRQDGPHAHQVLTDRDGGHVLAVDLGTDGVYTYRLDERTGRLAALSTTQLPPGTGPRHLAFHPSGRFAYLAAELGNSVTVCGYDPVTGQLTPGAPLPTLPPGTPLTERNYPAEVLTSADGRFVYVSNRGHNSVARFAVGQDGGTLELLDTTPSGGAYPRHIALAPSGTLLFAANQKSATVAAFHVDPATGALAPAAAFGTPMPVCVLPL